MTLPSSGVSKHHPRISPSLKLLFFILSTCFTLLILFQIQSLHTSSPPLSRSFFQQWQNRTLAQDLSSLNEKLRLSVTFLPLKDLRYSNKPLEGHTWFMSSMHDTHQEGEVQYQEFPSEASHGRLLCLKGHETHDGSSNYYALAWPEALPFNATLVKGLTFVAYNHYDYHNIWHSLGAFFPFVAWHKMNGCESPERWVLFQKGELRLKTNPWLNTLMGATFGREPHIEVFDWVKDEEPVCFEKAIVMRHNEGGMSRERRMEAYDLIRCKARVYCNLNLERRTPVIGMTMLMRTGARSFKNETAVIEIFERECRRVDGCRLMVAYANNLTVCDQVKLMSLTDILVSPHGAQLTNLFLMDRNSSIMEFYPKGWLKLAGVGQYVYRSMSSWAGMRHQGAWRDPDGERCPYPDDDGRCMSVYKNGRIGYNETFFTEWARNVLIELKARKLEEAVSREDQSDSASNTCHCG
ncbi:hypothetical protein SLA2020_258180 [Shorea laevis]